MAPVGRRTVLERRLPLAWIVAWRYIRAVRSSGQPSQMLSSTALAALFATSLGVTAMVIAMSLMTGYTDDLQRKLIGLQGEVIASPLTADAFEDGREALERARAIPGVVRMGRVAYGEGSLSSPALPEGVSVVLRGVEPETDPTVRKAAGDGGFAPAALSGGSPEGAVPAVLVGKELQRQLELERGDVLRLVVLELGGRRPRFRYRSVRFAATFSTGFSEFDARWVILDRRVLEKARGEAGLDVVEFKLTDPRAADKVAGRLKEVLGDGWVIQQWQKLNQQLFAALKLQEGLLFLVLGLIVFVSTFNVASTLMILVRERLRDIGVLAALGLTARRLWWIFAFYGLCLGALGILTGVLLGSGIAWVITEFKLVRFGPEVAAVYFIESVPFRVEAADVAAIVAFSLAVTFLACSLPALRAARVRPSVALRDE